MIHCALAWEGRGHRRAGAGVFAVTVVFLENFIRLLFNILTFAVFARVLMTWLPIPTNNRIVQVLFEITEPILGPVRRIIPPIGMIDISPIIALLLLQLLETILLSSLAGL